MDHANSDAPAYHPALAWLRFCHSGLSRCQQRELLEMFKTPQSLFALPANDIPPVVRKTLTAHVDQQAIKRDWEWSQQSRCHLIHFHHPQYPQLLKQIEDPPWLLYVKGEPACFKRDFIAIVGSRNPSPAGRQTAYEFARTFAECGWGVVSGLALGIDGAAHCGALAADATTAAVLGTGLDQVYPRRHQSLAAQITVGGALVTEFPLGTPARRQNFPQRNRIISGLSRAVLVIEASLRSGSLITARLAADQGREVCAVPGSIHMPTARGCHHLIRQGAKLVECAADVLEELGSLTKCPPVPMGLNPEKGGENPTATNNYNPLAAHLGHDPVAVDELIQRSGLTAEAVSSMLLHMEVSGLVEALPGGYYQRIR